jgi:polysaccharide export outer membrane protein
VIKLLAALVALALSVTAATAQDYRVQPGDSLSIEVIEDPGLNRSVLVLPDGSFSFPFVGALRASGQSVTEIQSALTTALAPNFAAPPTVVVSVGSIAERAAGTGPALVPIYVIGEVNSPGKIEVRRGTTLLQFLAESGGFTRFAATNRVQLRRVDPQTGQETVRVFDYRAAVRGATGGGAIALRSGDVVIVPERRLFE